jgi:hypothetical protein
VVPAGGLTDGTTYGWAVRASDGTDTSAWSATCSFIADANRLEQLLHEEFRWTSHTGETFSRRDYIARNTTPGSTAVTTTCRSDTVTAGR